MKAVPCCVIASEPFGIVHATLARADIVALGNTDVNQRRGTRDTVLCCIWFFTRQWQACGPVIAVWGAVRENAIVRKCCSAHFTSGYRVKFSENVRVSPCHGLPPAYSTVPTNHRVFREFSRRCEHVCLGHSLDAVVTCERQTLPSVNMVSHHLNSSSWIMVSGRCRMCYLRHHVYLKIDPFSDHAQVDRMSCDWIDKLECYCMYIQFTSTHSSLSYSHRMNCLNFKLLSKC